MMTDLQFAELVTKAIKPPKVVSASAVAKWRLGVTMPRKAALVAIGNVTDGEVTAESFAHAEAPS